MAMKKRVPLVPTVPSLPTFPGLSTIIAIITDLFVGGILQATGTLTAITILGVP